jgi:integrase
MAKTIGRLTHQLVGSAALKPGLYGDGGNLYLRVAKEVVGEDGVVKEGGRSWVFVYRHGGKQRELGLGKAGKRKGAVSLKDARDTAKQGRAMLDGQPPIDPRTVWRAQPRASARTFAQAAKDYMAEKEAGWKNAKHIAQWRHTIKVYCQPLHDTPVDKIGAEDVRSILTPIWRRAPETASRVRVRIAAVIDHAMPVDSMQPNPARLLAKRFAKVKEAGKFIKRNGVLERVERGNFPALPYKGAPAFAGRLRGETSIASRALEFLLLTASRTAEVIGAKWTEIDLGARLWTIPPERLKTGKKTRKPHVVPLSCRAIAILEEMREVATSDFVFPGRFDGQPLHDLALLEVVKRLEPTQTAHGLRSTFRDWVGEETDLAGELAELALGHVVKGVEGLYRRGTAIDRRRALMDAWSNYLAGPPPADGAADNVLTFARSA